ncbi:hypothetical protein D9C73_015129 [Collichthys lucidus]|uniref:Uncharacterized protein n=1 Tax=Collichthys lucidus TaxID=240159 RepID=A0A4U5V3W3_COLLU|nr:hypothetical protein D9C73_015129 [Collichthys lucidus]
MAAESTRRFTKNLLKPGSAAEIRQTACNAVRHSAVTLSGGPDIGIHVASFFAVDEHKHRGAAPLRLSIDPAEGNNSL